MQTNTSKVQNSHRTTTNQTALQEKPKQQSFIRGGIYLVDFGSKDSVKGSEQSGVRPAVVIQNNIGNKFSPTIIVVPITKSKTKRPLPTHVPIDEHYLKGLNSSANSIALLEQIKTVDKTRVIKHLNTKLTNDKMNEVDKALRTSLGLN